jgi:hypothetical protein
MLVQPSLSQWGLILRIPYNQLVLKYGKFSVVQFIHHNYWLETTTQAGETWAAPPPSPQFVQITGHCPGLAWVNIVFPRVIQINTKFANFVELYFSHFTTFRGQTLQFY